jgi:hypothetical protein
MTARVIQSYFPGRCVACGKPYGKGERISYDKAAPRGKRGAHVECAQQQPTESPKPQQQPGADYFDPNHREGEFRWRAHFDSLEEYAKLKPHPVNEKTLANALASNSGERWFGVRDEKEVRRVVAQGWPDGVARTLEALESLPVSRAMSIRRRRTRSDFGDHVDMQEVWRGNLSRAWETTARRQIASTAVRTLYVDICDNATTSAAQLFWRGAAALVVSDALSEAGYAVEIVAGMAATGCCTDERGAVWHTVTVKPAHAPLDLNALAATLCLSGYFRVFGFTGTANIPYEISCSFGQAVHPSLPGAIGGLSEVGDQRKAQEWINATLAPYMEQAA